MEKTVVGAYAVPFGWGSAGKLSAIVSASRLLGHDFSWVVFESGVEQHVLRSHALLSRPLPSGDRPFESEANSVDVAVVVLDPGVAQRFLVAGTPTVYVDSLPFLWTEEDPIPVAADVYCAQLCDSLPAPSWAALRAIRNLHWVQAIVSPEVERRSQTHKRGAGGRRAVINFGGLHSPHEWSGYRSYVELVLAPSVEALVATGFETIDVCGNVPPQVIGGVHIGARSHHEFLALLADTDVLVTAPGLTTLLEADALRVPTVCLPPQNLSQVMNGDRFATSIGDSSARMMWPGQVLKLSDVTAARIRGEDAALKVIYGAINRAAATMLTSCQDWLRDQLMRTLPDITRAGAQLAPFGARGAYEIASLVAAVARNADGVPRRARLTRA